MSFKHSSQLLLAAGLFLGGLLTAQALYIPLKAELGQWLLQHSWQQQLQGREQVQPWPWADTWPSAVLVAPRLQQRQVVLAGQSDRALAWGPVSTELNGSHNWIISGHRDTHFRWLGELVTGERLQLETLDGLLEFEVTGMEVVDSRVSELVDQPGPQKLTLVTCWPLDATDAGGPLRLVITATEQHRQAVQG